VWHAKDRRAHDARLLQPAIGASNAERLRGGLPEAHARSLSRIGDGRHRPHLLGRRWIDIGRTVAGSRRRQIFHTTAPLEHSNQRYRPRPAPHAKGHDIVEGRAPNAAKADLIPMLPRKPRCPFAKLRPRELEAVIEVPQWQ